MTGDGPGRPSEADWVDIHYRRPSRQTVVYRQRVLARHATYTATFQPDTPLSRPLVVDGDTILEPGSPVIWFTMPDLWYDMGLFHLQDGTFTGLYANLLTPVEFVDANTWRTTDLYLDVWVPASGGGVQLLDEDELADAQEAGIVNGNQAERVRREAEDLMRRAEALIWPPDFVAGWTLERARSLVV